MGKSGSGKSYLAKNSLLYFNKDADYISSHNIRHDEGNFDFSKEGRIKQAEKVKKLIDESKASIVIVDMICPYPEMRRIILPNIIYFIDNKGNGLYPDTDSIFVPPTEKEAETLYIIKYHHHD